VTQVTKKLGDSQTNDYLVNAPANMAISNKARIAEDAKIFVQAFGL
jgi:hypothetical protein